MTVPQTRVIPEVVVGALAPVGDPDPGLGVMPIVRRGGRLAGRRTPNCRQVETKQVDGPATKRVRALYESSPLQLSIDSGGYPAAITDSIAFIVVSA